MSKPLFVSPEWPLATPTGLTRAALTALSLSACQTPPPTSPEVVGEFRADSV